MKVKEFCEKLRLAFDEYNRADIECDEENWESIQERFKKWSVLNNLIQECGVSESMPDEICYGSEIDYGSDSGLEQFWLCIVLNEENSRSVHIQPLGTFDELYADWFEDIGHSLSTGYLEKIDYGKVCELNGKHVIFGAIETFEQGDNVPEWYDRKKCLYSFYQK